MGRRRLEIYRRAVFLTNAGKFDSWRAAGNSEPEDHAAILCEIMAGLVSGIIAAPPGADREFPEKHLAPWIRRFFIDLEQTKLNDFYVRVGLLGRH